MHIHQINGYIQTILLVEYHDKLMLLDAGCRCDVAVVKAYITDTLQRSMQDLSLVLISHMHPDHAGGAQIYQRKYGCKIASVDSTVQWYGGFSGRIAHWIDLLLSLYVARRRGKKIKNIYYNPNLKPDIILTNNVAIPGFEDWHVYATPGHTDRDLSFLHRPTQQMYTGDLILRLRSKFASPFPIYDPVAYKRSLNMIIDLNISHILMAHDGPAQISVDEIKTMIANSPPRPLTVAHVAKHRLKRLLSLRKQPSA